MKSTNYLLLLTVVVSLVSILLATPLAQADMVADYAMEGGQGTVLYDSSGYGNHGTISGASWSTSPYGSALTFDGVDDYVTVPSSSWLNPTEAITVMACVKWDIDPHTGNPWASIVNKNGDSQYRLHHNSTNTAFEFAISTTAGRKWVIGTTTPEEDRWYHVAGTYDGSLVRLYVDGLLEGSVAHSGFLLGSNSPLNLGRYYTNNRYFAGSIGDVRLYDHALTGAEIAQVIPEPATLCLLGLGSLALLRRKNKFSPQEV